MSRGASKSQTNPDESSDIPFEEAIQRLESIVETMESEDIPLETLLIKYEEGAKLAKVCQSKLANAELRVKKLDRTLDGGFKLESFDIQTDNN